MVVGVGRGYLCICALVLGAGITSVCSKNAIWHRHLCIQSISSLNLPVFVFSGVGQNLSPLERSDIWVSHSLSGIINHRFVIEKVDCLKQK